MFRQLALMTALVLTTPVTAQAFERISDRATFINTVAGKDLRIAVYGLTLNVRDDGTITGRAAGWDISGS